MNTSKHAMGRVVIIGGGASGALSAARLAERGYQVIAIEKAAIGNGSSGRSAACIRAQFGVAETAIGMRYSEWFYAHFHELLHTPPSQQPWVLKQNGYLFLYDDPAQVEPEMRASTAAAWQTAQVNATMQRGLGIEIDILTPHEVHQRWPHIEPEQLIGATWGPHDGFLNHDVIFTRGFARAQELGAELRQRVEVTGARVHGGRITAIETTAGLIEGDWFINATGAWAPRVSERLGAMPLPITPVKRFLYYLKPTEPIMDAAAWEALPMTIYGVGPGRGVHSRPDGESLMIGGSHDIDPEPNFTDTDQDAIPPAFHHAHGIENHGYTMLAEVDRYSPRLANCGGLHATSSGYYEMTPDGSPLIGFDAQLENLVHAAGFSGHGLMHAPITAALIEALIAGDVNAGVAHLPAPFADYTITLGAFDPSRDFTQSHRESMVL